MKSKFTLCMTYKGCPNSTYEQVELEYFTFPGGELQPKFKSKHPIKTVWINAYIFDAAGIVMLMLLKDILDREDINKIGLHIHYMPYARQDRICNPGEAFGLKVVSNLINDLNFDSVIVSDPHSDVTPALLDKCVVDSQVDCFRDTLGKHKLTIEDFKDYALIAPDAGASKKTLAMAKFLTHTGFIQAEKVRNVETGNITHTSVGGNVVGRDCLIVDDICDGGATFIALAKALKFQDAKSITLYVTHGIFSKGKQHLLDNGIDNIYCCYDWTE